jgi:hypothetical protein
MPKNFPIGNVWLFLMIGALNQRRVLVVGIGTLQDRMLVKSRQQFAITNQHCTGDITGK